MSYYSHHPAAFLAAAHHPHPHHHPGQHGHHSHHGHTARDFREAQVSPFVFTSLHTTHFPTAGLSVTQVCVDWLSDWN